MKHIVIDCRMIRASGIGRYLAKLLPRIIALPDWQFTLLGKESELTEFISSRVEVRPFTDTIYSISEQVRYPLVVPACDLFWSPHFNVPLLPIRAKKRLATIHDAYHLAFAGQLSRKENLYANVVYNTAIRKSDAVITVSQFSKTELLKYTRFPNANKVRVVYNGVESMVIDATEACPTHLINNPFLLFVGNVKPHKNLRNALMGFATFAERYPKFAHVRFIIVGKRDGFINGDMVVANLINEHPLLKERVVFTGYVTDSELSHLYRQALCLVFPSLYEGFGFPPLEAMASHTPVISSTSACMPEICGDAPLYFDAQNPDGLSESIYRLVTDEAMRTALIRKGDERIKHFSWDDCAHQHASIIESLLR